MSTFGQVAPQILPDSQFCTKAYSLSDMRSMNTVVKLEMAVLMAIPINKSRRGERPRAVSARR